MADYDAQPGRKPPAERERSRAQLEASYDGTCLELKPRWCPEPGGSGRRVRRQRVLRDRTLPQDIQRLHLFRSQQRLGVRVRLRRLGCPRSRTFRVREGVS